MHIGVIGAGVVGLTTAAALHERGLDVTVYEAESGPAALTSRANGGQLSYSYCHPFASAAMARQLPALIAGRRQGTRVRPSASSAFWFWGARFLRECLPGRERRNALALGELAAAARSRACWLREVAGDDWGYRRAGKLVLLTDAEAPQEIDDAPLDPAGRIQHLSREQACEIEPSLASWQSEHASALYCATDAVGDSHRFSNQLAQRLRDKGVCVRYSSRVQHVAQNADSATLTVICNGVSDTHRHDAIVFCAANSAPTLLPGLLPRGSLLSLTGYSVSLPIGREPPTASITSVADHLVIARLDDQIRIAGFADINARPRDWPGRTAALLHRARALAPLAADYDAADARPWVGHRPATPDSLPIVGATRAPRVFLNLGHGALGWTLCAATAEQAALAVTTGLR
ncbi:MAG: FAD-dependent oxidoreductase [Pseudomonadota bacterium]